MKRPISSLAKATLVSVVAFATPHALADLTIGVSIALTGPTSALGIPTQERHRALAEGDRRREAQRHRPRRRDRPERPQCKNTRRFINEDKVDVIVGSVATPVAAAMADVAAEGKTVQLMLSPVNLHRGQRVPGRSGCRSRPR